MRWPFIYGHIATATGWTFAQIDDLTLWDTGDLFTYWQEHPPTHVLVGAYLLKDKEPRQSESQQMAGMTAAVHSLGGTLRGRLPECYRTG